MRKLLALACGLTVLATGYLSLSLLILRPPRANYGEWFALALFLVFQSFLTLLFLLSDIPRMFRFLPLFGGAGVLATGIWMAYAATRVSHFEGYALLLGALLAFQGVLTFVVLGPSLVLSVRQR